jgi:hypothetical protein
MDKLSNAGILNVFVRLFVAVDKMPHTSNLNGEGFILAHSFRGFCPYSLALLILDQLKTFSDFFFSAFCS